MEINQKKGSLFAIISGLCYGLVGYFGVTIMHENLSMFTMLFWRFLISSLLIGLLIVFTYIIKQKTVQENFHDMLKILFLGGVSYSATAITYFISSFYIGTGLAMVIFFTYPAMIMFFNWAWYRKPIPKIYYVAITLIIIGMLFLADLSSLKYDILGIGAGIFSALCYSVYIVSGKKTKVAPLVSTLMVSLGCMLTCLILAILQNSFITPATFTLWSNLFVMAVICTAVPILLLLESLKYISEEKASILSVLEPVFVVIFGILLLGEKIGILQIIGIVTILSGALITLLSKKA